MNSVARLTDRARNDLKCFEGPLNRNQTKVYDVKVGRCSLLNEYMNLYGYQRSFVDHSPRSLRFNIFQTSFPEKLKPNFMWSLSGMGERKFVQMVQVT